MSPASQLVGAVAGRRPGPAPSSNRDRKFYEFVRGFELEHGGDGPSYRDVVNAGIASSTSHVANIAKRLADKELIELPTSQKGRLHTVLLRGHVCPRCHGEVGADGR